MLAVQRRRSISTRRVAGPVDRGTDTVAVSDAATRTIGLHVATFEVVTESDLAEKFPLQRSGSDSVTVTSSGARLVTFTRAGSGDVVPVADFAAEPVARNGTDTVSVAEGAPHVGVNPRDTVSTSDAALRLVALITSGFEAVAESDTAHRTYLRGGSDTVTVGEGTHRLGVNPRDTVTVVDSTGPTGQTKVVTDTVAVSEGTIGIGLQPQDTVAVSDTAIAGTGASAAGSYGAGSYGGVPFGA